MLGNTNPFPLSQRNMNARLGNDLVRDILAMRNTRDYQYTVYDFDIKALDTTNVWTVAAGAGATTWAARAEAGGWLRGVTGTSSGVSGLQLSLPNKYWTPASVCGMAVLVRLSDISEVKLTAGFADALPSVNTTIINSNVTPTFNTATAGAMAHYHHSGTTTITGLYTIGTTVAAAKVATTTYRPTNSVAYFIVVECNGSSAYMFMGDNGNNPLAVATSALASADGLIPFVEAQNLDANSTNVDIDFFATWSGRLG